MKCKHYWQGDEDGKSVHCTECGEWWHYTEHGWGQAYWTEEDIRKAREEAEELIKAFK